MKALLVRVGIDKTAGEWNAPANISTKEFVYIPIPEKEKIRKGYEVSYDIFQEAVRNFDTKVRFKESLKGKNAHLDPDFRYLTYGDKKERGKQINEKLEKEDIIVFYSSFRDPKEERLIYGIIGIYIIAEIKDVKDIPKDKWLESAHTRRISNPKWEHEIVVYAKRKDEDGNIISGRLSKYIPIGEFRDNAYRIHEDLLIAWGGVDVENGWIQRSARLPKFNDPSKFYDWLKTTIKKEKIELYDKNN
jgi:hypothetical protein